MTPEELETLETYARAASAIPWQQCVTPTRGRLRAMWWACWAIWRGRGPLWGVMIGNESRWRWVATTGNAADSEANSAYIHAAQPHNVLMLIQALRDARASIERAASYLPGNPDQAERILSEIR